MANSSLEEYSEPEAPLDEDKYSITPNILDEDIIIPIHDDEYLEPTYNLSQSENTVYNNVIFDEEEVEESDFEFEDYITPIHNEEEAVSDEVEDSLEGTFDPYESSVEILNDVDKGIAPQETKKTDVEESSKEHQSKAKDTLGLDNIESFRKTLPRPTSVSSVAESLPIPKLLNSYVICDRGILTSQEAFEEVAKHSKEELLLEVQSINDLTDSFLSSLTNVKSRVIIQDVDLDDSNYKDLLSSLMEKGVEIRTLSSIDSFNLISDDSYALLISNAVDEDSVEYGAVYNDADSISNIKSLFESSWQIAKSIELNEKDET